MKKNIIDAKINISRLVEKYPESVEVLMESGLGCVGCMMATGEKLEDGAKAHGLTDEEIKKMVDRINEVIGSNN